MTALACGGGRDRGGTGDSAWLASRGPEPVMSFRIFATQELSALRPGISLRAWHASHGADRETAPQLNVGPYCKAMTSGAALRGGLSVARYALFYPKPPPEAYPADVAGQPAPDDACELGAIVLEMKAPPNVDTLVDSLTLQLRQRFGSGPSRTDHDGPLSNTASRWRGDSASVGVGRLMWNEDEENSDELTPGDAIVAMAFLPPVDSLWQFSGRYGTPADDSWLAPLLARAGAPKTDTWRWVAAMRAKESGLAREVAWLQDATSAASDCESDADSLITSGDSILAVARDSQALVAIHFVLADAAAFLLRGATPDVDARFRPVAIRHYRAALALDRARTWPQGRENWFELWRLSTGQQPWFWHFFTECGD